MPDLYCSCRAGQGLSCCETSLANRVGFQNVSKFDSESGRESMVCFSNSPSSIHSLTFETGDDVRIYQIRFWGLISLTVSLFEVILSFLFW